MLVRDGWVDRVIEPTRHETAIGDQQRVGASRVTSRSLSAGTSRRSERPICQTAAYIALMKNGQVDAVLDLPKCPGGNVKS
jgi:hypothetical protein